MTKEEAAALTALATGIGTTLALVVEELRRLNEGRDQWYREVLEVLTEAKKPSRCGVVFGEDVFHGTELRCTLDSGHAGFHDDSNDEGSPVGSGQPAAAPVRPECGGCNMGGCPDCEA